MKNRPLRNRESVYCPTCQRHTEQSYGPKRGERHCFSCGERFTLQASREAERAEDTRARISGVAEGGGEK